MSSAQAVMKELRNLKQEEATMINLASKVSDQLNRLKVEELALQNMVRLQNEELERRSRASQRSINRSIPDGDHEIMEEDYGENDEQVTSLVPVDLFVNNKFHGINNEDVEEEDDDDDDDDDDGDNGGDVVTKQKVADIDEPEDIEQFVNSL